MKRLLFLYITVFLVSYTATAQNISYGIRAGVNLIPIQPKTIDHSFLLKPGLNAGVYLNYRINKSLSLQPELLYSYKTTSYSKTDTSSLLEIVQMFEDINAEDLSEVTDYFDMNVYQRTQARVNMNYIELPIMLAYTPFDFLNISAGIYGSYLISAKSFITYKEDIPLLESTNLLDSFPEAAFFIQGLFPAYNEAQTSQISSKSRFSSFDFGVVSSISIKTEKDIIINLRYTRGMWNYNEETFSTKNVHSAFQLILAYPLSNFYIRVKPKLTKPSIE